MTYYWIDRSHAATNEDLLYKIEKVGDNRYKEIYEYFYLKDDVDEELYTIWDKDILSVKNDGHRIIKFVFER